MSNREIEDCAIKYVLKLELAAGRKPRDTRTSGEPVDIISPPRMIEVKAFGKIARGQPIPLEQRQVDALRQDQQNFYLYVVDNIESARAGLGEPHVLELDGAAVAAMVDRTKPTNTYWPTLRAAEYDDAPRLETARSPLRVVRGWESSPGSDRPYALVGRCQVEDCRSEARWQPGSSWLAYNRRADLALSTGRPGLYREAAGRANRRGS